MAARPRRAHPRECTYSRPPEPADVSGMARARCSATHGIRWARVAVGTGVLLTTLALGPWSGAEEGGEPAAPPAACAAAELAPALVPVRAGGAAGGLQQAVTATVPAIVVVDVVEARPLGAWTNTGRPPMPTDEVYVRLGDGFTEAAPAIRDAVLASMWLPANDQGCDRSTWVAVTAP